jgi:putative transcriptional regulator
VKNKKLKMARLACDMSQDDLARAVGVTRQTIGAVENGSYNPTLKLCVAICRATGKTLNDLFWEENDEIKCESTTQG